MLRLVAALSFLALVGGGIAQAASAKDTLTVDLPNDVATMDPQVQWDTDSYSVYRNIFDNLVTRDTSRQDRAAGRDRLALCRRHDDRVRPARATSCSRTASKLTPDDVVFSVKRIIDPAFKQPAASPVRPDRRGRGDRPGAGDAAHQDALSGAAGAAGQAVDRAEGVCARRSATRSSTSSRSAADPTSCDPGSAACRPRSRRTTPTGAASRRSAP